MYMYKLYFYLQRRTSVTQTVIPVTSVVDSSPQSLLDEHNQIESDNEVEISWSEVRNNGCSEYAHVCFNF